MQYISSILFVVLFAPFASAQQMHVHKTDNSTVSFLLSEIDSITFSIPDTISDTIYTVNDIDGNIYHAKTIGTQVWLLENLKTTRYRSGDSIVNVTDNASWSNLLTGAYCNYDNDSNNAKTYGRLYNWIAVNDNRNIAPEGWHVATDDEWTILTNYLGGASVAGGKLKEAGTVHWTSPNNGGDNSSGFTALPGGYRGDQYGLFENIRNYGYWWSSTEGITGSAWCRGLYFNTSNVYRYSNPGRHGFSVRCVKD